MGRTPPSSGRRKHNIRFHDTEWARVEARARACGLPPATFVRRAALGTQLRARRNRAEDEVILHLDRIGMELRRLAEAADPASAAPDPAALATVLEELLAAVRRIG